MALDAGGQPPAAGAATRRRGRGRGRRARARAAPARARPRRPRSAGRGASRASASHRGQREPQRHGLERRDPRAAGDGARGRREVGLGDRGALEQRAGVADEHERRVGQPDAAAGALEQAHARLALEHRELLRDGRWRELQRVGDGRDRAALVQLAQQAQAAELEHRKERYRISRQKSESLLMLGRHDGAPCARRHPPLPRLRRRVRRDGRCSASSRTTRARRSGRCSRSASRSPRRCSGARARAAARRRCARCRAATSRSRLALGAVGYALQAGALLRRARRGSTRRCSRCCSTRSRRSSRSPRSRSGASASTAAASVALALASAASCSSWRAPAPARSTRSARRSACGRVSTARTSSLGEGVAARVGAAASCRARVHRRGDLARRRRGAARRAAPGRASRRRAGAGSRASRAVSTVVAIGLFFAGLRAGRPDRRVDPRRPSSRRRPSLLAFVVFGETLGPSQFAGGALVLPARAGAGSGRPCARPARRTA